MCGMFFFPNISHPLKYISRKSYRRLRYIASISSIDHFRMKLEDHGQSLAPRLGKTDLCIQYKYKYGDDEMSMGVRHPKSFWATFY